MDDRDRSNSEDLFRKARAGGRSALGRLFERFRPELKRGARAGLNGHAADQCGPTDLVQDTFLSAVRGFARFQGQSVREFRAWLWKILGNKQKEKYRYWSTSKRDRTRVEPLGFDPELDGRLPRKPLDAGLAGDEQNDTEWLNLAISKLKPDDQVILKMKFYNSAKYDSISAVIGVRPSTLRKQTDRILEKLELGIPLLKLIAGRPYTQSQHEAICLSFFQSTTQTEIAGRVSMSARSLKKLLEGIKKNDLPRLRSDNEEARKSHRRVD